MDKIKHSIINSTTTYLNDLQYLAINKPKTIKDLVLLSIVDDIYDWANWVINFPNSTFDCKTLQTQILKLDKFRKDIVRNNTSLVNYQGSEEYYLPNKVGVPNPIAQPITIITNPNLVPPLNRDELFYRNVNTPQTDYTWRRVFDYQTVKTAIISNLIPVITVSPTTLGGFTYKVGAGPSQVETFSVSAVEVSSDVIITPSSNFEISLTTNSGFVSTPILLTPVDNIVDNTTIYVRMKAGLISGVTSPQNLIISSTGAASKAISVAGIVEIAPYYYGYTTSTGIIKPAPSECITVTDGNVINKRPNQESTGDIELVFNNPYAFCWFAIPSASGIKRGWYETLNPANKENIPGVVFSSGITYTMNNLEYSFYITNYQTEFTTITIQNNNIQ